MKRRWGTLTVPVQSVNEDMVETLRNMLDMSYNLHAISDSLHKWDPVGSRFNSAWYILNFRIQDIGNKLTRDGLTKKEKEEELAAKTKDRRKGKEKKKKTTKTGDAEELAVQGMAWGQTTSARFDSNGGTVLFTGLQDLQLSAAQLAKQMNDTVSFLPAVNIKVALKKKANFSLKYSLGKAINLRLLDILRASK